MTRESLVAGRLREWLAEVEARMVELRAIAARHDRGRTDEIHLHHEADRCEETARRIRSALGEEVE